MIEMLVHAQPMDTLPQTGEVFVEKRNLQGDREVVLEHVEHIRQAFDNNVAWSYEKYQILGEGPIETPSILARMAKARVEAAKEYLAQQTQHVEPLPTLPSFRKILLRHIENAVNDAQPRAHWPGAKMIQIVVPAWHNAVEEYENLVLKAESEGSGVDADQSGDGSNADQT